MGWKHVALPAALAYATGGSSLVPSILGALKGILPGKIEEKKTEEGGESATEKEGFFKDAAEPEVVEIRDFREGFQELLEGSR
jgi:hypothetical protein